MSLDNSKYIQQRCADTLTRITFEGGCEGKGRYEEKGRPGRTSRRGMILRRAHSPRTAERGILFGPSQGRKGSE